jgi:Flp pilus assembly protein TadB
MTIGIEPLIYIGIFIGVVLLVEGIYLVVFGRSISLNNRVNRRLEMLDAGIDREEVLEQLRKEMGQHLKGQTIPLYSLLAEKAQKANIAFPPSTLILMMGALAMVAFTGLSILTEAGLVIRVVVAIGMGVGAVYMWVNNKAKKRLAMIEEQLPDAIELMVRSLRVGHPFSSAINIVAKEVADPLGSEFGVIADEAAYGRDGRSQA